MSILDAKYNAPCLTCKDRKIGCHGKCEKYKKYAEAEHKHRVEAYRRKKNYRFY